MFVKTDKSSSLTLLCKCLLCLSVATVHWNQLILLGELVTAKTHAFLTFVRLINKSERFKPRGLLFACEYSGLLSILAGKGVAPIVARNDVPVMIGRCICQLSRLSVL